MTRIAVFIAFLLLTGCGTGIQRIQPTATGKADSTDVRAQFEARGFHVRRALDRQSSALSYTCATRYFVIQFAERDALAALSIAEQADAIYERISEWLSFHLAKPLNVVIVPEMENQIPYGVDSRLRGVTQSRSGTIRLTPRDAQHMNRFAHGLAKLFLRRVVHDHPVQWWFMAGMSEYLAYRDQINPVFKRYIFQETFRLGIRRWDRLARTDGSGGHPPEMYMASLSVLLFLVDQYGEDRLRGLLGDYNRNFVRRTFPEAFERHYKSQIELEHEWYDMLTEYAPSSTSLEDVDIERLPGD